MKIMQIKFSQKITSFLLSATLVASVASSSLLPVFAGVTGDGSPEVNEAYANNESLQPLPGGYNVDTILKWTPESDPDARYVRASIPLESNRFTGPLVNSGANPDAKLMLCSLANSNHDQTPAQGSDSFDSYAFGYWQYVDDMVYWAGSSEGIFVVPTPDIIDSAHKNGVPVTATIGFPWGPDETEGKVNLKEIEKFTKREANGSFKVADQMVRLARYYGFDGYFFNQETYGGTAKMAKDMRDMMLYVKNKYPGIIFSWYDSMTESGEVDYADGVDETNKFWLKGDDNGNVPVDEFFMNYNWGGQHDNPTSTSKNTIKKTIDTMRTVSRSPYAAYAGFEMQQSGIAKYYRDHLLVDPETGKLKLSIALYCPNSTQGFANDPVDFHKQEQNLYVTSTGDPTNEPRNPADPNEKRWVGMARFFADKSVITKAPFVTNFNTGHGKNWYVDGQLSRTKEWNNRSMQDILPTWTWTVKSGGTKLAADYDFEDAYNGGNSVKLTGKLDSANEVMLYSTKVSNATTADVTYKANKAGSRVELGVCYGDTYDAKNFKYYPLDKATAGKWDTTTVKIDSGKISALSIRVNGDISDYKLNIGRIALNDETIAPTSAPKTITLDEIMYNNANEAQVRMYWDDVPNAAYYELYRVCANGGEEFINATPNNAFYIPALIREKGQKEVTVKVIPVNQNGDRGMSKTLAIKWGLNEDASTVATPDTSTNVCIGATVTGFSAENPAEPAKKAIDGTSANGSKWCVANDSVDMNGKKASYSDDIPNWLSIKLDAPKTIKRVRFEHAGAGGENFGLNTKEFKLEYKEGGAWKLAKAFVDNKDSITDVKLDKPITAQEWKLTVTKAYGDTAWAAVRIYDWQMFESDVFPQLSNISMSLATAKNNDGAKDTFTLKNVPYGTTVNLYASVTAKKPLVSKVIKPTDDSLPATLTAEFDNLNLDKVSGGRLYYSLSKAPWPESNRLSVSF